MYFLSFFPSVFYAFVTPVILYSGLGLEWVNGTFQFFLSHNHTLLSGCLYTVGWSDDSQPVLWKFFYIYINKSSSVSVVSAS
jgi:hypothetical protein